MKRSGILVLVPAILVVFVLFSGPIYAQTPTAVSPYKLTVFATAPTGLSAPDSLAVLDGHVFVGYGDNHAPDGSDGLSSQVVEYRMDGSIVRIYTVLGHNDGLKVDPITHRLWALQNEDANARLVIIDPRTQDQKLYLFGPAAHGGGYDDIVFRDCKVYISASNPQLNPNTAPAIVSAQLNNGTVDVAPVLLGDATATDIPTGATVQLNLQDPDSMTLDLHGNIVLDSQADQELIFVSHPGSPDQGVRRLPLSYETPSGPVSVETDDTAFVSSSKGFILFADKVLNTVFILTTDDFDRGTAYTAADGGPFVGTLNLSTGVITPVVTGLGNPGGLIFVDTSDRGDDHQADREDEGRACRARDSDSE